MHKPGALVSRRSDSAGPAPQPPADGEVGPAPAAGAGRAREAPPGLAAAAVSAAPEGAASGDSAKRARPPGAEPEKAFKRPRVRGHAGDPARRAAADDGGGGSGGGGGGASGAAPAVAPPAPGGEPAGMQACARRGRARGSPGQRVALLCHGGRCACMRALQAPWAGTGEHAGSSRRVRSD